ncbi:hypothetical protein [Metamycoplasma hominis]|uniref:hypothetical protein n=1 Tax=Metamycoplasma hominis TaxID=2098 RepID=UPI0012AAE584|nr:hypothetical protein [Metamycoplasma hominis]
MNNSLKTIEDKYNSALEKKDENALKIEIIKMENFYKLIKTLFASYLSEIASIKSMMYDDNKKKKFLKGHWIC